MISLVVGQGLAGLLESVERPLKWLHLKAALRAEAKRSREAPVKEAVVVLSLVLTRDQLERLLVNPDVEDGLRKAELLREGQQLPSCPSCGAARR